MSSELAAPLLSACLIVKDEEKMLTACLESVKGVVDEIIVYDTGSTDATMEIARAAGAKVVEGYWDQDFARARNSALEHASGQWILTIDADETFMCDPAQLRLLLGQNLANLESYIVPIENLERAGASGLVHSAIRVAQRNVAVWRSRLHEQMVSSDGSGRALKTGYLSGARIIHRGYLPEVFAEKNKAERNIATAKAALNDGEAGHAYAMLNYARSLTLGNRTAEAEETLRETAAISSDPYVRRSIASTLITIMVQQERYEDALEQILELRQFSTSQIAADISEARIRIARGEPELGLAILARVPIRGRDDEAMEYGAHMLAGCRGKALAELGRYGEAVDVVLEAIRSDGVLEVNLGELVGWMHQANRHLSEIANALDAADLIPILGLALALEVAEADTVLDGAHTRFPDRLETLAAARHVAPRLSIERALIWSSRFRQRGLASSCPLVAMANNSALDPRTRILACAAAFGAFGERAVVNAVRDALDQLDAQGVADAVAQIGRMAPGLLEADHVELVTMTEVIAPQPKPVWRGRAPRARAPLAQVSSQVRPGGVNVVGAFQTNTLEGEIARNVTNALVASGLSVSTTNYCSEGEGGPVAWTPRDAGDFPFLTTVLAVPPSDLGNYVMDLGAAQFENRYTIGIWRSEYDRPSAVMSEVSSMVGEIWAPSKFAADAIARATDRRVAKMTIPFSDTSSNSRFLEEVEGTLFLANVDYATGFERQNPLGAVEAFCAAFRVGQGPRLVIETTHSSNYPLEHAALLSAASNRPDIKVIEGSRAATGQIVHEWKAERTCFVSLHRSEGSGFSIARAMKARVPAIVTAHSCGSEYLGERDSLHIPYSLEKSFANETYEVGELYWAQPNLDRAAAAMRLVDQDSTMFRVKARRANERALRSFSAAQAVRAIRSRLAAIEHQLLHQSVNETRRLEATASI